MLISSMLWDGLLPFIGYILLGLSFIAVAFLLVGLYATVGLLIIRVIGDMFSWVSCRISNVRRR